MDDDLQLTDYIKDLLFKVLNFVHPSPNIATLIYDLWTSLEDEENDAMQLEIGFEKVELINVSTFPR